MGLKLQIIHVGNMANKGAQALLKSEVAMLREMFDGAEISVSTFDVEGVKLLGPPVEHVITGLVDVPYKRADLRANSRSYGRDALEFKVDLVVRLLFLPFQALLALASCIAAQADLRPFYRTGVVNSFKNCDIVISTSDENFKEGNLNFSLSIIWLVTWWSLLFERTLEVVVAKRVFHKKVVMFPNSVGPFRTFVGRLLAKNAFKQLDLMLVRDRMSLSNVEALGVKLPIKLTVDVAINFQSDAQNVQDKSEDRVIGVAAGTYLNALGRNELENYVTAHAKALDYMIQKYNVEVVFLPHDITGFKGDDYHVSKSILEEMRNKNHAKITCVDNVDEYKSAVEQVEILVSSKMHPAVLASSSRVPAMYIVYDHKQTGFFEHLGFSEYCLNIKSVSYSSLARKMETLWNDRKNLSELLNQRVPILQQNVKNSIRNALLSPHDSESHFTKRARDDYGDDKRSR